MRLFKWSLLLRRESTSSWEQNNIQNFVCAQLLESMEDQNVRKFVAFASNSKDTGHGLLVSHQIVIFAQKTELNRTQLWVFNPDIKYSSSRLCQGHPRRAMKILYEIIEDPLGVLNKNPVSLEELPLPDMIMEQLEESLKYSYEILPEAAKRPLPDATMCNWKVALLDRFEHGDTRAVSGQ